jgi:hypothetical protein
MVEYLSGNRIQGSSTLTTTPPQTSWKELTRATVSSGTTDSFTTSSFTAKDNLMIMVHTIPDGQVTANYRFNADSGSNYARRQSSNGASDGSAISQDHLLAGNGTSGETTFVTSHVINTATQEKLVITQIMAAVAGAGNAPARRELVGKWANTSAQITSVTLYNNDSGSFAAGTEIVILGYDNDEADSNTNFWQELASVELGSTADEINSGTFTAKKYLMVQLHGVASGSISGSDLQFNGDTGSNYARRYSGNGASDGTGTSETTLGGIGSSSGDSFVNWFIINKSDKEKLVIGDGVYGSTGAGNAPDRRELTGKWSNTSAQITSIKVKENASGGWASGSTLKVWGFD